jgi:N-methylhydantoinase B
MPTSTTSSVDPVTAEVLRHGLSSTGLQMSIALRRAAVSPLIYDMLDFSCGLLSRKFQVLAQGRSLPVHSGTMGAVTKATVEAVGGAEVLKQGDVLFNSYGYDIGQHPQDCAVVMPVFLGGELIGYASVRAHQADLGAKAPYCSDTTDNFQEGVIFPGVFLQREGVRQDDIYRSLLANSRFPQALAGDLAAQVVSCETGARGLTRLVEKYGLDRFEWIAERIFDHGEAILREALAAIPDGRYEAQGEIEFDGVSPDPIIFDVAVEVSGSDVIVDFSDAPEPAVGPINCPLLHTRALARISILSLFVPDTEPVNEGQFRPINVRTTPGTLFHALPPAPLYNTAPINNAALDAIHRALGAAVPELVPASAGGDFCGIVWWGEDDDGPWSNVTSHATGQGGGPTADGGAPLVYITASGLLTAPAESLEQRSPFIVRRMELSTDSGGPGKFRGGLGYECEYELLDDARFTSIMDRTATGAAGYGGGGPGTPNAQTICHPDGRREPLQKCTDKPIEKGATMVVRNGGGGGYGDPTERDPGAVRTDLVERYVSEEQAREFYPQAFGDNDAS